MQDDKSLKEGLAWAQNFGGRESVSDVSSVVQLLLMQGNEKFTTRNPTVSEDQNSSNTSGDTGSFSSSQVHQSLPLSDYKSQIRLVEVLPGQDDDPIVVKLFVPNAINSQPYEALSYVWGSRDADESISLNDTSYEVSANLAAALRYLRHAPSDGRRTLWIDALCIDQSHNAEKSDQVALMGEIYGRAADVLIFLGEESDDSDLVMRYLALPEPDHEGQYTPASPVAGRSSEVECGCRRGECLVRRRIHWCNLNEPRFLSAADAFFRRPWWSRVWVVQEFALAQQDPKWYWGKYWASSQSLSRDIRGLHDHIVDQTMPMTGHPDLIMAPRINREDYRTFWQRRYNLNQTLAHAKNWSNVFPAPLMVRLMHRESTDPRDRVFALYEMLDPISKQILYPDYSVSLDDLKRILSAYILLQGQQTVMFRRYELAYSPNLPSWTVDFTKPYTTPVPNFLGTPEGDLWPMPIYRGILGARGVILDKLDVLIDIDRSKGDEWDRLGLLWNLEAIAENHQPREALSPDIRSSIAALLVPFPMKRDTLAKFKVPEYAVPFPSTGYIWGALQFIAYLASTLSLIPAGYKPDEVTCDKWTSARPIHADATLRELYSVLKWQDSESFVGAACFDRPNLEAQIQSVELPRRTRSESINTSPPQEEPTNELYRPRYSYLKNILRKSTSLSELKVLQAFLCEMADTAAAIVQMNRSGQAPNPTMFIQQIQDRQLSSLTDTIISYRQIIDNCSCRSGEGEEHQRQLKRLSDVLERKIKGTASSVVTNISSVEVHHDSFNTAIEDENHTFKGITYAFITRKGFLGFSFQHGAAFAKGDVVAKIYGMSGLAILEDLGQDNKYRLKGFGNAIGVDHEEVKKLLDLGVGAERELKIT